MRSSGGAVAITGHMTLVPGDRRPAVLAVDPARAACLFERARAGHPLRGEQSVMAMTSAPEPPELRLTHPTRCEVYQMP